MQRLFSIFPNSWPGGGLLVLRFSAGGMLLTQGAGGLISGARLESTAPAILGITAGLLLLIGMWTPVSCFLAAAAELWLLFRGGIAPEPAILLLSTSLAVAMLGPGSWSIDAVLFGRRRVNLSER